MGARKRQEDSHPDPFPEDFGERLEQFTELAGLSWEEFAERLGIDVDRVMEWREGVTRIRGDRPWGHTIKSAKSICLDT